MVTLSAGGSGEAPSPSGNSFTARTMVAKGAHPLTTRRRRVGKGTISGYGGGYKQPGGGVNVVDSRQSASTGAGADPLKGGTENINATNPGAPAPNSSNQQQQQAASNQPQHSGANETSTTAPSKPCHSARMSALCCQNAIRMGARAQLGLCPPGRPRRSLQAALRQRTRSSSNSAATHPSRRLAVGASDPNGYYAIEKMIGTQSLEDYEDQEEDYLLSTNTFDVESDEEASSGDEDELSAIDALLSPDSTGLDDPSKYLNMREPLFTPIGVEGTLGNPNGAPMASGMGSGASGKLPFNRRKMRYFDGITAQDRQAARAYLTAEADKARRRSALLLKQHLRRMQKEERRKRRILKGEPAVNDENEVEDPKEAELIDGGVAQFEQPMTAAMSAALILESLRLNPKESIEGMAKCYDGIVAAGVALLEAQNTDPASPTEAGDDNEKPRTSRADVLSALAPLLITSLDHPSGDAILLLARMRRMCGTPRYQRRFVQRVAPCLVRPKNAAIWCLRHQHDMEPIIAAVELIFDSAHTIFSKGWYEKGQLFLADSKRAETLNSAAAQLRNLSGEPQEGLSLGFASTHSHGIRRYTSAATHKDNKSSKDQLAEWEVMAVDKEIRLSISKIMSSDWSRVNLNTGKDSDSVRSFRRNASASSGKRPTVLPQSSSGDASPRAMILSPRSPSRPMAVKTPLSPPPPKDFSTPGTPSDHLFENIVPTPPQPADRPTSPDSALVQKSGNGMVMSPPMAHRHAVDEMEPKTIPITSSTPPRSPKSPMRDSVEQAPPLAKLSTTAPTPFTPISPRRAKALSPPSSQNMRDSNEGRETSLAPFTPSLGISAHAPLSPSSAGTNSTSDLVGYRPSASSAGSVGSTGTGASQAAHYRTLTSTASERKRTVAACRALRAQITRFEDAFIQLHGRPPKGAAERAPLATTYSQYREWKRAIRADAACRIQALFRGARTRWVLMRSEDARIRGIVGRRAGRRQFARQELEQAPRQATGQAGLFLPNEIGESEHSRSSSLKPSPGSSVGTPNGVSPGEDPFSGQPSGQVLTPQSQWANQVVRRRHEQQNRTPDGFPIAASSQPRPSPVASPVANTSLDVANMSLAELQAKKRELKQQLKQYDMNFARKNGRMPVKAEKEPIRHLYENYNALKGQISMMEQEGGRHTHGPGVQQLAVNVVPPQNRMMSAPPTPPDSSDSDRSVDSPGLLGTSRGRRKQMKSPPIASMSTPAGAPSQDLAALKAEKGQLHQMLRSYEKDFFKEHRRQVSSFADIKPVASQYRRYKEIKKAITALQGASER